MFNAMKPLCVAALAAIVAPAFAAEWMTDLEAAKARAAAEGKAVLVDFTGSDWCGWCIRLRKDVFDTPAFEEYARDKFVLMEVDIPNNPAFDPELKRRNQELCEQFKVDGFPTIMVLTPQGETVGGFVGGMPNLEAARKPLDAALANAAAVKAAEALEGEAQVKALYAAYQQLPEELRAASSLRARLVELDAANVTGIQDEVKAEAQMNSVMAQVQTAVREKKDALPVLEAALKDALPQNRARFLELKATFILMSAQTVEDIEKAKATMLEVAELVPEKAATIREVLEKRYANPAAVLQIMKRRRGE